MRATPHPSAGSVMPGPLRQRVAAFTGAGPVLIIDDRGHERQLIPAPDEWPPAARPAWWKIRGKPVMPDAAWTAEWAWARAAGGQHGFICGVLIAATVPFVRGALSLPPAWPTWAVALIPPILVGFSLRYLSPLSMTITRRRMAADLRRAYLQADRCPSCGYSLLGLSADADGCVTCPECGAGWRIDRER